jgi:tetratricopeptide (TPR) repeat protein
LLSALVSTSQPEAVSNLVENTTGLSVEIPNPNNPVEKEYLKLLAEDDAAQAEVDRWIMEDRGATNHSATLTLRIEQRFDSVKKDYENFLQRNPKHVRGHLAFGSFLQEIREEQEGVKHWEIARGLDPKNPAAWNNLANYYGHHSPVKKAFEYYAKAIELDPKEPVYLWNFATTVYLFRKDAMEFYQINETQVFDKALDLYRQAMKLAPNDFILASDYAQSFYGTKPPRYSEGLVAWTDVMKIARDNIERDGVRIHLGRINWKLNHFAEARRQLNAITNEMYSLTKKKLLKNIAESEKKSEPTPASAPTAKE